MSTIAERVAAGAAWLDETRPGWWEPGTGGIDLGRLDMADECLCVLGQVFAADAGAVRAGFDYAVDDLHAPESGGGFNVPFTAGFEQFAELDAEWRRLITGRRARTGAAPCGTGGAS